jgi:hypothetical protein
VTIQLTAGLTEANVGMPFTVIELCVGLLKEMIFDRLMADFGSVLSSFHQANVITSHYLA